MRLIWIPIAALAVLLNACGGSSAGSETTAEKLPGAPPPVLPLPTDPWAVIPAGPTHVAVIHVAAVRATPYADILRQWIKASGCLRPEDEATLFDKTERMVLASVEPAGNEVPAMLAVLEGSYGADDAAALLYAVKSDAPVAERMHKRVRIRARGDQASASIGGSLIAMGTPALVDRAAELAEGARLPRLSDGDLLGRTGADKELTASAFLMAGDVPERAQSRLGKQLATVGLPRDTLSGTLLGLLKIDGAGVLAEVRIRKPSAELAADTAAAVQRKLGQLSLLARIAGLPPVLDRVEARGEGELLRASLAVSHDEVQQLLGRMRESIDESARTACAP